jgi:hypothetical protein
MGQRMLPRRSTLKSIRGTSVQGSWLRISSAAIVPYVASKAQARCGALTSIKLRQATGPALAACIREKDKPVFSVSVCLAGRVVPWHTFNLIGFGPVSFKHQGATVRPGRSASIAAISTFQSKSSDLPGNAITDPHQRYEMKNPTFAAELHKKLGAPSRETLESLRLLKAFLRLAPRQRFEVIELIERLAIDPAAASDGPLS